MSNKQGNIKLSAALSYGVILFSIAAGLFYTPWMVKQIGRDDYGLYILVTTFLAYFVVDYGMWQSINKLLSQYRAEGNEQKIKQTIGVATKIYLFFDIVICVVLCCVYFFIDTIFGSLSPTELVKFKTVFLIAGAFSVLNFPFGFVRGVMYSFEYLTQSRYYELAGKIGLIITTIIVLLLGGGLYWLVLVYAFVPLVKNILSVQFLYRKGVRMDFRFWSREAAMSIFGISVWLLFYVLAELFVNNISPTIISIRNSLEQVSVFAIGLTIYSYVYQITNSVAGLFLPKVSKMRLQGQHKEIDDYAIKIGRLQLIITGFLVFGIIVSGSQFINAWMGEAFANSYYVACLMTIPGLIIYSQQIELAKLYAENKIFLQSAMMLLTAITSVTLSYILTPEYGAIGAAIGIAASNFVFMAVGMNVIYRKVLNFDSKKFYTFIGKFVGVFTAVALLIMAFTKYIYEPYFLLSNEWLNFLFVASIYAALYCVSVYFLLMNRSEKELVISIIKKIKR